MQTIRPQEKNASLAVNHPMCLYEATEPENSHNSFPCPTYEQVDLDRGNYDIINREEVPRPHPLTQLDRSHDPTSDEYYATLENTTQEHDYHVLETTNNEGPGHADHSVLEKGTKQSEEGLNANQRDLDVFGVQPQNYEIPRSGKIN